MRSRLPQFIPGMGFSGTGVPDAQLAAAQLANRARFGVGAPGVLGAVNTLLPGAIKSATFRTNFTPPFTWTPGADASTAAARTGAPASSGGSATSFILDEIQPALDVELASGQVITIAPRGEPTEDYRTKLALAGLAVVGVVGGTFLVGYFVGRCR